MSNPHGLPLNRTRSGVKSEAWIVDSDSDSEVEGGGPAWKRRRTLLGCTNIAAHATLRELLGEQPERGERVRARETRVPEETQADVVWGKLLRRAVFAREAVHEHELCQFEHAAAHECGWEEWLQALYKRSVYASPAL